MPKGCSVRLKLKFGIDATPIQCDWQKKILDFPKVVSYNFRNWEWIVYNDVGTIAGTMYELIFGELKIYDPRAIEDHPTLAEIIGESNDGKCDCGGDNNPGSGGHWIFCKTRK
jgi:hypothetical protein